MDRKDLNTIRQLDLTQRYKTLHPRLQNRHFFSQKWTAGITKVKQKAIKLKQKSCFNAMNAYTRTLKISIEEINA